MNNTRDINKEWIDSLILLIEQHSTKYSQVWFNDGTPECKGCLAHFALWVEGRIENFHEGSYLIREHLGLTDNDTNIILNGIWAGHEYNYEPRYWEAIYFLENIKRGLPVKEAIDEAYKA